MKPGKRLIAEVSKQWAGLFRVVGRYFQWLFFFFFFHLKGGFQGYFVLANVWSLLLPWLLCWNWCEGWPRMFTWSVWKVKQLYLGCYYFSNYHWFLSLFEGDNSFFSIWSACCISLLLREFSMCIQKGGKNSSLNV